MNNPDQQPSERSIWAIKPWWCQPWSIVLTGLLVVGSSWWLVQRWWLSTVLGTGVLLWWWLFLVVVPAAYRNGNVES